MKILQVIPTLGAGGAEGFVTNLSVSLADLGGKVRIFLLGGVRGSRGHVLYKRLQKAVIQVAGVEERKLASVANLHCLTRLIRSWKPDIVQANLYSSEVACALARVFSARSDTHYIRRLASTEQCGYRSAWKVRLLDQAFQLAIANSPSVARAYSDFLKKAVNSRLTMIRNGAHLLESAPTLKEKAEARHGLNIPNKAFVIAHIGGMRVGRELGGGLETTHKGHDILLKAFARGFGDNSNCIMLCVGDGPLRPAVKLLARELGLNDKVRFLGEVPEPWPVLHAADLFCFPSRYEGLPNVLPEAASCGLPVVASDIPEIRTLYPGKAWMLVTVDDITAFSDALRFVRANLTTFQREACDVAGSFRDEFSMKACAAKYIDAYTTVCNRGAIKD